MPRKTPTVQLVCCAAALLFGLALLTLIYFLLICVGALYAFRSFAFLYVRTWFAAMFGLVPAILVGLGTVSAITVTGMAYTGDPNSLPLILSVLTAVYATTYGVCLLAGFAHCLAISAAAACLKQRSVATDLKLGKMLSSPRSSRMFSNPLVRMASLASLGVGLTATAVSAVQLTIVYDLKVATELVRAHDSSQPATAMDDRFGEDSLLNLATAIQTRIPGNVCAGLSEEDRIAMLPNGRALVRRAVTRHTKWTTETRWPLAEVYVTRCDLV